MIPAGLRDHWCSWLGASDEQVATLGEPAPGASVPDVVVVGSARRAEPGWDGEIHPLVGIVDPSGRAVLSVAPEREGQARQLVDGMKSLDSVRVAMPALLGLENSWVYQATYRWSIAPARVEELPDLGRWVPVTDPRLPLWLHPFGGKALVAFEQGDGTYLAGVGLKRHDSHVSEIAVGTDDRARGRGLARRLVAQAARELLSAGVIPTYLHDPSNVPSARVAVAAGFPDRGWTALGVTGR